MEPIPATLQRNWWAVLLRGLAAIGFSVVAWARPGPTLAFVVIVFGMYAITDGVVTFIGAMRAAHAEDRWLLMAAEGVFGVLLGLFTLLLPVKAMAIGFVFIAAWALCTGAIEVIEGARMRRHIRGDWLLLLSGLVRLAFGALLLSRPRAGVMTLLGIAAAYALVEGVILVGLSFGLRRHGAAPRRVGPSGMSAQPA